MANTKKTNQNSLGFTLIELILYIALLAIFISGAVIFAWDIIYGRVKSQVQRNVSENLRIASQRIAYEIRNASDINSASGSTLSLANENSSRNPTIFDLSSGQIRIAYGTSGPCPTSSPCDLTNNNVTVSDLSFTNLTSGVESANVKFSITINSNADRKEWQKTQTYTSSAELRVY